MAAETGGYEKPCDGFAFSARQWAVKRNDGYSLTDMAN